MRIIEQSASIISCTPNVDLIQQIENLGRVCYKSENKITPESGEKFVANAIKKGHYSVLEMATISLIAPVEWSTSVNPLAMGRFIQVSEFLHDDGNDCYLITGSVRAFMELPFGEELPEVVYTFLKGHWPSLFQRELPSLGSPSPELIANVRFTALGELAYLHPQERAKHVRVPVRFITSRTVSHQLVRYRLTSPLQESQRYCNYTSDRFHNSVTFIRPSWALSYSEEYSIWLDSCKAAEESYFRLSEIATSEKAREVLPNCTKTELIIYADLVEWQHIFKQRVAPDAYYATRELLEPVYEEFKQQYSTMIS